MGNKLLSMKVLGSAGLYTPFPRATPVPEPPPPFQTPFTPSSRYRSERMTDPASPTVTNGNKDRLTLTPKRAGDNEGLPMLACRLDMNRGLFSP